MPVTKSAAKRVRQNLKHNQRNLRFKRAMTREVKALVSAIAKANTKDINEKLKSAQSALDKAAKEGVIHKNKASRKKSQLAGKVKAASKSPVKKVAAKKPVTKKTTKKA